MLQMVENFITLRSENISSYEHYTKLNINFEISHLQNRYISQAFHSI